MNPLVMYRLLKFCEKNGIDSYEIDSALTYDENMEHLERLVTADVEMDIAEAKSMEEYYNSVGLEELTGLSKEQLDYSMFYSLVWFNKRKVTELRLCIRHFKKHVKILTRTYVYNEGIPTLEHKVRRAIGYVIIKGNIGTVHAILNYLRGHHIYTRVLKTSLKDSVIKAHIEAQTALRELKEEDAKDLFSFTH